MSALRDMLKRHEGLKLKPYRCTAGKLTIGYGRNLDDVGISAATAERFLDEDIGRATRDAQTFTWFWDLSHVRQDAVIDMLFAMGLRKFSRFKKTIAAFSDSDFARAADEILDSDWAKSQAPERAREISEMVKTDKYRGRENATT